MVVVNHQLTMWSFFTRDPAKDFPYEIGDLVPGLQSKSIWELHKGKKKGTDQEISIFVFEVKGGNDTLLDVAKASVKRLKTLRHPNILQYIDSLETDKVVYLVTEYVEPLLGHLELLKKEEERKLAVSWGLFQIAKGLGFLTGDCGLSHNNVSSASVFVDRAGEWKMGGVEYMCPGTEAPPIKTLPSLDRYAPPELADTSRRKPGPKWCENRFSSIDRPSSVCWCNISCMVNSKYYVKTRRETKHKPEHCTRLVYITYVFLQEFASSFQLSLAPAKTVHVEAIGNSHRNQGMGST